MLSVGVAASGSSCADTATQAVQGFITAVSDGRLLRMLILASLGVSNVAYTPQLTITTCSGGCVCP